MKLITNKSKNLLYCISVEGNVTVQFGTSYAVATQRTADSASVNTFKIQGWDGTKYTGLAGANIAIGKLTTTFTTPSTTGFKLIRFGLNGASIDTLCRCEMDLKPSTTYTFTCNFTNITQGSISWKDMMLVEGSTVGDYEPYSYNLLDKWHYPASTTTNGVTFTNNGDGSITANGTAAEQSHYHLMDINFLANHKYLLKGCPFGGNAGTTFMLDTGAGIGNDIGDGTIGTVSSLTGERYVNIYVRTGYTANSLTFYPQLYDLTLMYGAGNEPTTVNQFYIDHPELEVSPLGFIGLKNLEISNKNIKRLKYATTTRNLFDIPLTRGYPSNKNYGAGTKRTFTVGTYVTGFARNNYYDPENITNVSVSKDVISFKIVNASGYGIGIPLLLIAGQTYTASCVVDNNVRPGIGISYYKEDGTPISYTQVEKVANSLTVSFTIPENTYFTVISFYGQDNNSGYVFSNIQLEEGSTATPYVPYGYLDLGIIPSNSGYILDKYNNLTEELLEENIEKDNINYHIPDKTNILLNKVEGKTNKIVQIADKSKYSSTSTTLGVKFTNNSDGTFTITGTNDGTDYSNYPITNESSLTNDWLKGHKYLFYFSDKTDLNYYAVIGGSTSKIEYTELGNTATGRSPLWKILSPTDNSIGGNSWYILRVKQNATCTNELASPQVFDLTAMYGFGKEPTTVEQFKKDYPQFFDSKLDGIWNVRTSGISTTGKNLFIYDTIAKYNYSKDYKKYNANNVIFFKAGTYSITPTDGIASVYCQAFSEPNVAITNILEVISYDSSLSAYMYGAWGNYALNMLFGRGKVLQFTLSRDCYLTFCADPNVVTNPMIELGTTATTYEPYQENKIDLLSTQTLNGINGVNDYIEVIDKGNGLYDLKKTQNIASVDMGSLGFDADGNNFVTGAISSDIKTPVNDNTVGNYICQKYVNCALDKSFVNGDFGVNSSGYLYFRDSAYTTVSDFQTAVTGTMFYYQLNAPVVTTIATNLTYNQVSAIRTNGGLLLVNDNNNQKYVQPDVTLKENFQYKS